MPTDLATGDPSRLGRYELLGRLGSGGQGVVYLGRDPDGGLVALKTLRSGGGLPADALALLSREVEAARRVAPFCTAAVLDADLGADPAYVVSEYVPGPTLAEQVASTGPVSGSDLDRLAVATITGVLAIHRVHLVHRDLKPANIVLGPDGPRLIDFGIARDLRRPSDPSLTAARYGTLSYTAPERLAGEPAEPSSDVFAWACTMVFAATGRPPFRATDPVQLMQQIGSGEPDLDGVPAALRELLASCLAKSGPDRPSPQAVLDRLVGPPAAGPVTEPLTRTRRTWLRFPAAPAARGPDGAPRRRSGMLAFGLLGAAAVLAALTVTVLLPALRPDADPPARGATSSTPSSAGAPLQALSTARSGSPAISGAPAATATPVGPAATGKPVRTGLNGTWTGTMTQPRGLLTSWTMVLTVTGRTGRFSMPDMQCTGPVKVRTVTSTVLVADLRPTRDPFDLCARSGRLTLTLTGQDRALSQWRDDAVRTNVANGSLRRG